MVSVSCIFILFFYFLLFYHFPISNFQLNLKMFDDQSTSTMWLCVDYVTNKTYKPFHKNQTGFSYDIAVALNYIMYFCFRDPE